MGPDGLFVSQRTGSHSAGIHVPFTNCFVCRWFCVVHDPKPPLHSHNWLSFGKFQDTERFLIHCERHFSSRLPPSGGTWKYAKAPSTKKTWRDSLPIDMLLSAVSVLVVAQSSSEIPEGLMNNPVYIHTYIHIHTPPAFVALKTCFLPALCIATSGRIKGSGPYFLQDVPTGPTVPPACCSVWTGRSFPGDKAAASWSWPLKYPFIPPVRFTTWWGAYSCFQLSPL